MKPPALFARLAQRWSWRHMPWIGGGFIAVIAALALYDIVRDHRATVAATGRELDAHARVLAEQTARSVQAVDLMLRHVAAQLGAGALARLGQAELHALLQAQALGLEQIEGLTLSDEHGRLLATSVRYPLPTPAPSVAQIQAFQHLRAQRWPGLAVDRARESQVKPGLWVFPIVRRIETQAGQFAGTVAAGGRIDYFQQFYRDVRLDEGTKITLMHLDGTLLARHPPVPAALGQRYPLFDSMLAAHGSGATGPSRTTSPVDGIDRFAALERVPGLPLAVVVTRDAAVALAPWRAQALGTAGRTLALGVLAGLLLVLLQRQFGRVERARRSLELSRERFALAAAGADDGIWDWDVVGDRVYGSARAQALFGLQPRQGEEALSLAAWFELVQIHPDDGEPRRAALRAHLAGATPHYEAEYRVRHPDGSYRWVRARGLCTRDAQGAPLRMAGSVSDIDARKRAEDALRLSEERYALAMIGSTGGHWVWELASDELFVSGTVNQLFGLPADLQPGTRAAFFALVEVHPEDLARLREIDEQARQGRVARLDFEYRIRLPDGAQRWILTRAQCFRDAAGAVVRVAGVSVDISERKRTEEALRLSEERFALAVAGSHDGIIDWDIVNDRMYTSERTLEMVGADTRETLRTRAQWLALLRLHPDERQRHADELQAFLAGRGSLREGEFRVQRADGEYRWVRLRNLCVRDAAGRPLRLAGSVSDIDAYKRVEAALRESEERYALAMTGSNEGHWVWELHNDELFASARLAELVGLAPQAGVYRYAEFAARVPLHADDRERVRAARRALLDGTAQRLDVEYRIVLADGEQRWLHVRAQCFRDAQGRPRRIAGSTVDATERKHAEEALRRSEQRYALAVAGSDDGVWDFDYVEQRAFASARARQILGLPAQPEVQPLQDYLAALPLHPDDVELRNAALEAHLSGAAPAYEGEWRVRHADGGYRWVRVRGMCVRDAAGRPLRIAGSASDIDARRRAEDALRLSEQRFALAVAGANDGILDWDIVADSMYVSERALHIVGIDPATPIHTRAEWSALLMPRLHPDDARRLVEQLASHPDGHPAVHDGEYRIRHDDGEYRWTRFRGMNVRDAQGRPIRWAGSLSDIDAEKRTEEALRRSEERYQLAVAGSNEGLWDWDLASDSLFLSPRAQEILWLTPGEPVRPRRQWIALSHYHPDDRAQVRAALAAHLRGHTRHFKVEYRLRHHSGEWHWYSQRGIAVRDAQGRPTRMAGSMEDITDRKNSEAERERLETQLRQAQKLEAIGTLAGGIAHDFNNILAAILGYGEMAQKSAAEGSAQRRYIDAALSAGMRAKSLVERILAFSRSGMGERVPVRVESVVAEALDLFEASLPAGVQLQRQLSTGDAAVLGDPTQVHQVVMNLCANAAQAMKGGGRLTVRLDRAELMAPCCATSVLPSGSYIRLSVRDTGNGIAPGVLERIFDPFFTTKEVGVGTGLGLSLVHGIVTDLGGGIDVASRLGQGSTFTVLLPWQGSVAAGSPVEEAPPLGHGETVLLVDDEETLVRLGEEMIAALGYEPVGFTSSIAALETLRQAPQRFDVVLSDEAMPEMTGSELARAVHAIRADIPIVLMSGYVTAALNQRARQAGVAEVLAKPLVERDIARCLASALQA